jgi:hypothetical protein
MRRLAAGDLRSWHGLPEGLTREDADRELGPAARDHGGRFGGSTRVFRHHPATPAAPNGVDVWFGGDVVVGIEYGPAVLPEPPDAQLGPPEAIVGQRHVYASRGLAFDIRRDGLVERVIAFAPALTEFFRTRPPGL